MKFTKILILFMFFLFSCKNDIQENQSDLSKSLQQLKTSYSGFAEESNYQFHSIESIQTIHKLRGNETTEQLIEKNNSITVYAEGYFIASITQTLPDIKQILISKTYIQVFDQSGKQLTSTEIPSHSASLLPVKPEQQYGLGTTDKTLLEQAIENGDEVIDLGNNRFSIKKTLNLNSEVSGSLTLTYNNLNNRIEASDLDLNSGTRLINQYEYGIGINGYVYASRIVSQTISEQYETTSTLDISNYSASFAISE